MKFSEYLAQGQNIIHKLLETIPFIVANKLWTGFLKQRLALLVVVLLVIFVPWSLFNYLQSLLSTTNTSSIPQGIAQSAISQSVSFSSLFEGGNKYLVLALIQMLVVYFSNKTIESLSGVTIHLTVKEMIHSQFRVLSLIIRNWFIEIILGVIVVIILSIFNLNFLSEFIKYLISGYFVGYFFIDNYNHTFAISIKDSAKIVRKHVVPVVIIGLVAKILFLLPLVGGVIASFICSVSATWYMHTSEDSHNASDAYSTREKLYEPPIS